MNNMAALDDTPDLSHLTEEERKIIQEVLERQKVEEKKEHQVQVQYEKELDEVERQINERKEVAAKQVGTQDDAICQICQKTKFADGIGHKCYYCQLRSCARCGGRTQIKVKPEQKISLPNLANKGQQNGQKTVWACSLCQKKQQILAKTGKWFHKDGGRPTTPTSLSPTTTPTPPFQTPGSFRGSVSQEFRGASQPQASSSLLPQQFTIQSQQQGASSYSSQRQYDNEIDLEGRRYSDADQLPSPSMAQRGATSIGRTSAAAAAADHSVPVPLSMNPNVPQIRSDGRQLENDNITDAQRRREQNLLKQPGVPERRSSANEGYPADQREYGPRTDLNRKYSEMPPVKHQTSLQRRLSDRRVCDRSDYAAQGHNGRTGEEYKRYNGTGDQTPLGYENRRPPGDVEPHLPRDNRDYDRIPDRISRPMDLQDRRYREQDNEIRTKENGYPRRQMSPPDQRMQQPKKSLSPQRTPAIQEDAYDAESPQTSSHGRDRRGYFRDNSLRPDDASWNAPREYDSAVGRGNRNEKFASETDRDRRHRSISYSYQAENQPRMPYDDRDRNRSFRRPSSHDRGEDSRNWGKDYGRSQEGFRNKDTYLDNDDGVGRRASQVASPPEERRRLPFVSEMQEYPEDRASMSKMDFNQGESPPAATGLGSYDRRYAHQYQKRRNRADSRASDHVPRQRKNDTYRFGKFPNYPDYTTRSVHSPSSSEEADETASTSDFPYGAYKKSFIRSVLGHQRSKSSGDVRASKLVDMLTGNRQGPSTSASFGVSKQLPVTWQISPDASRLIGRMIFKRQTGVSLGLKVIGGRPTPSGRLSAFITRVQKGSVADYVGQLRPGDEVLEWNGRCLLDVSFDEVCQIINDSKYDDEIDILISRQIGSHESSVFCGSNLMMPNAAAFTSVPQVQVLDPTISLLPQLEAVNVSSVAIPGQSSAVPLAMSTQLGAGGSQAPVVMITGPADVQALAALQSVRQQQLRAPSAQGQIFGSIEIALLYSPADEQLAVTVYQAMDLPPRSDGCPRNPYVKLFLLPDRGEKSRRQSNILANTCRPVWQQSFIYQKVSQADLTVKVLEVTLWDYDQFVTNDFLGEVLFDLSMSLLDNEPRWYTLTDMNEESPIRVKLRQLRPSAYSNQGYQMSTDYGSYGMLQESARSQSSLGMNFGYQQDPFFASTMPRSRTYNTRYGAQGEDLDPMGVYPKGSGYTSDSIAPTRRTRGRSLDPSLIDFYSSETGLDPQQLQAFGNDQLSGAADPYSRRHLPRVPPDMYGEEALRELDDKVQQLRSQGYVARRHRSASDRYAISDPNRPGISSHSKHRHHNHKHSRRANGQQRFGDDNRTIDESQRINEEDPEQQKNAAGYFSDGSETSLSITSTQSEHPRTRTAQEFQRNVEMPPEEQETYDVQDGTMSDSAMANSIASAKSQAFNAEAKRKKSLMTRLIPGRGNAANSAQDQKRLGFRRSDEVGIPTSTLSPQSSTDLVKQTSKESTDSNDSTWMPKMTNDGNCLGEFVPGLGPGQVVGRQVLASPCMGEIQLRLTDKGGNIEVNVIRAKQLAKKPGAKCNAAPYVKVYLMDGKHCIAKAKTAIAPRTADPKFDQLMLFTEPYKGKFLQISVWGDYGRMERRIFMGIALIKLDKVDLSKMIEGWYKLYHANSLVGTASPARKDSENSAAENSTAAAVT